MSRARDEILATVKARLGERSGPPAPMQEDVRETPAALRTPAGRLTAFREILESVGGTVTVVSDESAAAAELERIATDLDAREVAISDSALVERVTASLAAKTFDAGSDRERLAACDFGVTTAQWGIAETGTLVLDSSVERSRLASLVPSVHVAILASDAIHATLGDALSAVRREGGDPACVTFITGPSRTADIELTLVVGVHGPEQLRVIVIAGSSSSLRTCARAE